VTSGGKTIKNLAAILVAWFATMTVMTLYPGITKTVLIPFPQRFLASALPEDVAILRWDSQGAVLFSERPDFVLELYKSGVPFVLPYRKSGCVDLRDKKAT
jgi:hypothetical protein